jgi:hypothetical protein
VTKGPLAKRKKRSLIAASIGLTILSSGVAAAVAEQCIDPTKKECKEGDLKLYCNFKSMLNQRTATYQEHLRNTQATLKSPGQTREGIRYDGIIYKAALAEAIKNNAGKAQTEINAIALAAFNRKVREKLDKQADNFDDCGVPGIAPIESKRPTWAGMHTSDEDCSIYGDIPKVGGKKGEVETIFLSDLKQKTTACLEFFDMDKGHEQIHEERCRKTDKDVRANEPLSTSLEEELDAYRYSVAKTQNDVNRLFMRCSADIALKVRQAAAEKLLKKVGAYKAKVKK